MVIDVFMLDVTRTLIYVETVQRLVIHYSCTLLVVGTTKHVIIYTGRGVRNRSQLNLTYRTRGVCWGGEFKVQFPLVVKYRV